MRRLRFALSALPAASALMGLRMAQCGPNDDKRRSFGSRICGADTVNELLAAKLVREAPVHTLEMQARGGVNGERLLQLGADHSVPAATAIAVGAGFPDRMVWAGASAETKAIHTVVLVPNSAYDSIKPAVCALKQRPGGPPRLFTVDDMPNNEKEYLRDLSPEMISQDLKHGIGRILKTLDPSANPMFAEICGLLRGCYMEVNKASKNDIIARLKIPAGRPGGLLVGGKITIKAAQDGLPSVQKTLKAGDFLTVTEIDDMLDIEKGACFFDTFDKNLRRDWHSPWHIRNALNAIADKLDPTSPSYNSSYGCVTVGNLDNASDGALKVATGSFSGMLRLYQPREASYRVYRQIA